MILGIACATMQPPALKYPGDLGSWIENSTCNPMVKIRHNNVENLGVVGSYQQMYEQMSACDVIMFIHDDVICREKDWDRRVLKEFDDPSVMVVGFGGALAHGVPDLYKVPYHLPNLVRINYRSAVDDAIVHGELFTGECDVAVLDGFVLAVRRQLLDRFNVWAYAQEVGIDFIAYDYLLCCITHRLGYRIRMVGVKCHHKGGGTSVGLKIDRQQEYDHSHRFIYDEFKDVLPWRC